MGMKLTHTHVHKLCFKWMSPQKIYHSVASVINNVLLYAYSLKTLFSPGYSSNPSTHTTDYRRSGQ